MITGMKDGFSWESGLFIARKALKIPDLQLQAISLIYQEWLRTQDQSLITPDLKIALTQYPENDICKKLLSTTYTML